MTKTLEEIWKEKTGTEATEALTLEYKITTSVEGCCELCYTDVTEVTFYISEGTKTVSVYGWEIGIHERMSGYISSMYE